MEVDVDTSVVVVVVVSVGTMVVVMVVEFVVMVSTIGLRSGAPLVTNVPVEYTVVLLGEAYGYFS